MFIERVQEALAELETAQQCYSSELAVMPDGILLRSASKEGERFYQAKPNGSSGYATRKGITNRPDLIRVLARKQYLKKALPRIASNIKALQMLLKHYKSCNPYDIVESLSSTYRTLPIEAFFHPQLEAQLIDLDADEATRIARHASWGEQPYSDGGHMREGRKLVTSRGLKVRSKAELLIAERLYAFGIPFRYEQELWLEDGSTVYPDFTFEGADGLEFHLEFCGMMDDKEYAEKWWRKCMRYRNCGIVPWKNIIYVYAQGNDMNVMHIDAMIRMRIIPWL